MNDRSRNNQRSGNCAAQLVEVLCAHRNLNKAEVAQRAVGLLSMMRIEIGSRYPIDVFRGLKQFDNEFHVASVKAWLAYCSRRLMYAG